MNKAQKRELREILDECLPLKDIDLKKILYNDLYISLCFFYDRLFEDKRTKKTIHNPNRKSLTMDRFYK